MGMVHIGVQAYIEFLDKSSEEECSYSFAYISRELVQQPDALVGGAFLDPRDHRSWIRSSVYCHSCPYSQIMALINHPTSSIAQAHGADLLAAFIRAQVSSALLMNSLLP